MRDMTVVNTSGNSEPPAVARYWYSDAATFPNITAAKHPTIWGKNVSPVQKNLKGELVCEAVKSENTKASVGEITFRPCPVYFLLLVPFLVCPPLVHSVMHDQMSDNVSVYSAV